VKNYPAAWTFPMIVEKHSDSEIQGLTNRVNVLNRKKTLQTRFHALDGHLKYLIRCTMSERGNALDVNFSKTVNNSNSKELESLELYLDRIIDNVRLMRTRHNDTVRYIQESSFSRVQKMLALENSKEVSEVFDRIAFMGSDNEAICFAILGKHLNAPAAEEQRLFNKLWDVKKDTLLSIEKEIDSMYEQRLLKSNIFSWFFAYVMPGIRKILQPMLTRLEKKVIQQKWDSSRSLSVKANVKFTLKDLYSYIAEISLNAIYTAIYNLLHNEYNFQNFIFRLQMMLPVIKRAVQFLWNKLSFHVLFGSGEFLLMHTNLNLPAFLGLLVMGVIAGFTLLYKKIKGMAARPGPGEDLARIGSNAITVGNKIILVEKYDQLSDTPDLQYHVLVVMRQMIGSQMIDSHNTSLTFEPLLKCLSAEQIGYLSIYLDKIIIKSSLRTRFNTLFNTLDFDMQNLVIMHMRNVRNLQNVDLNFKAILETYSDEEIISFGTKLEQIIVSIQNRRMLHDAETIKLKSDSVVPENYWKNHSEVGIIYDRMVIISPESQPKLLEIIKDHVKGTVLTPGELDFQLRSADKETLYAIKEEIDRQYTNKELS